MKGGRRGKPRKCADCGHPVANHLNIVAPCSKRCDQCKVSGDVRRDPEELRELQMAAAEDRADAYLERMAWAAEQAEVADAEATERRLLAERYGQ